MVTHLLIPSPPTTYPVNRKSFCLQKFIAPIVYHESSFLHVFCESFDDHGLQSFSIKGIRFRTSSQGYTFWQFWSGQGYAFWQFWSKTSHTLVIPVKKPKIFWLLSREWENLAIFVCKMPIHATFDVEFSLAMGIIFTKIVPANSTILKLWAVYLYPKFSREPPVLLLNRILQPKVL